MQRPEFRVSAPVIAWFLTGLQKKGNISRPGRRKSSGYCRICADVCPFGRKPRNGTSPLKKEYDPIFPEIRKRELVPRGK